MCLAVGCGTLLDIGGDSDSDKEIHPGNTDGPDGIGDGGTSDGGPADDSSIFISDGAVVDAPVPAECSGFGGGGQFCDDFDGPLKYPMRWLETGDAGTTSVDVGGGNVLNALLTSWPGEAGTAEMARPARDFIGITAPGKTLNISFRMNLTASVAGVYVLRITNPTLPNRRAAIYVSSNKIGIDDVVGATVNRPANDQWHDYSVDVTKVGNNTKIVLLVDGVATPGTGIIADLGTPLRVELGLTTMGTSMSPANETVRFDELRIK